MSFAAVLPVLMLVLQQQASLPTSPIKRIEVLPATRTIVAGDSVHLELRALDADGKPVPGAVLYSKLLGGEGEGSLQAGTGWLVVSSVGKFPLSVSAVVPGYLPFVDTTSIRFQGVPGPATRIELSSHAATIATGQSLPLTALAFSKANDRTRDSIRWQSSLPKVASVDRSGVVTGVAPGRATLTASVRGASASLDVRVVPATIGKLTLSPSKPTVRQGDVVAFSVEGRDGAGKPIANLTPTWSFSPGDGQLDADGGFVAYRPGDLYGDRRARPRGGEHDRAGRASATCGGR